MNTSLNKILNLYREQIAWLLVFLAVIAYASFPVVASFTLENVHPISLTFYCHVVAFFALLPIVIVRYRYEKPSGKFIVCVLFSGLCMAAYDALFFCALNNAPKIGVVMINLLWPLLFAVIAPFFLPDKGRLSFANIVLMLIANCSVAFTLPFNGGGGGFHGYKYAFLAVLCGVAFNLLLTFAQTLLPTNRPFRNSIEANCLAFMFSFISLAVGMQLFDVPFGSLDRSGSLCILYIGIFAMALGQVFWVYGVSFSRTPGIASLMYLCPFLSIGMFKLLFPKETVSSYVLLGLTVTLFVTYKIQRSTKRLPA